MEEEGEQETHYPYQQQQQPQQPPLPSFLVRIELPPQPQLQQQEYRVGPTEAAFVFDCCTQGLTRYLERIARAAIATALATNTPSSSSSHLVPPPGPRPGHGASKEKEAEVAAAVARALFLAPLPEQYGRSALMAACVGGQAGTLRSILGMVFAGEGGKEERRRRAVLNARDEIGATGLLLAAVEGHTEVGGWGAMVG